MSSRDEVLNRLSPHYTITPRNGTSDWITHVGGEELDQPIQLELDELLLERYLDHLTGAAAAENRRAAVGMVKIYLDETVESALTMGQTIRVVGLRSSRRSRAPEWFVLERPRADRTVGTPPDD